MRRSIVLAALLVLLTCTSCALGLLQLPGSKSDDDNLSLMLLGILALQPAGPRYEFQETTVTPTTANANYDYRVGRVRHVILDNVAERLGLTSYDKKSDAIVKLRHLLAVIEMILVKFPDPRLPNPTASDIEWAQRECQKAYDFIVIKPEYLLSRPSAERFYEWLARFETTIDGSTNPRPRKAHVFFAKPFLLSEYYADYKKEKKVTVEKLTARLRADTQALLDQAVNLTEPLVRPYDIGAPEKPGP